MSGSPTLLSVVVPAHNASGVLERALTALAASTLPRTQWELVVVDDGSSDDTATLAARFADVVVRIPGRPHGPAYARNRGVESSRGDVVVFIDSDCVVHADTLQRFWDAFQRDETVGAVFGSYDDTPVALGVMSQYRNLIHHYVHHQNAGDVETFWAGAGAVRRDVFVNAGMYDEWHFARPQIEDIELGARIRAGGYRILLDPAIQVTHLKRWTLLAVIRTDVKDRGIPWARLLAHRGAVLSTKTLNLRWTEKVITALVWAAAVLLLSSAIVGSRRLLLAAGGCLAGAILLNAPVWRFFMRQRGVWFTIQILPAHLLYYLLNGISLGVGLMLQQLVGAPIPDPTVEAYSEVGVKRWPPIPARNRPSSWTANEP
ncbi:MAG TPA: glycosyltransferase [Gemmatimonadaceae bacterium]|nr:glycosyltransferase [Gemmatimonadaceae bacterium]